MILLENLNLTMKTMNNTVTSNIPNHSSTLIDQIYDGIPQETFNFVANRMELALRIDNAMKSKGWSQKEFAAAMHKKPSEISRWLSGTHNFTTDTLWHIEQVLDIRLLTAPQTTSDLSSEGDLLRKFVLLEVNKALEKYLSRSVST